MMSRQITDPEEEDEEIDNSDAVDDRNQDADFPEHELPVGFLNNLE